MSKPRNVGGPSRASTYGPGNAKQDETYQRPRRPNPSTLQYLCSLPLDDRAELAEHQYRTSEENKNNDATETSEICAAAQAALEEIQSELASLAGDERGSQRLETVTKIACTASTRNTRIMLRGMVGYYRHLAMNRYGSHVVQTLLSICAGQVIGSTSNLNTEEGEEEEEDDGNDLPSMEELILNIAQELSPYYYELSVHVCGSHVLRALLCVLGGVAIANDPLDPANRVKRGKKAKKKKKKAGGSDYGDDHHNASKFKVDFMVEALKNPPSALKNYPSSFKIALRGLSERVLNSGDSCQDTICHPSSGPLIIMLLQVLVVSAHFYDDVNVDDDIIELEKVQTPKFANESAAQALVHRILGWDDEEKSRDIIFRLSSNSTASHFMETVLKTSNNEFHEKITERSFLGHLPKFCENGVANFVVQILLMTSRNKSQAQRLGEELLPIFGKIIHTRKGIVWRLSEVCSKYRILQHALHEKLCENLKKTEIVECVTILIAFHPSEEEGGKIKLDSNGCRIVMNLLRFSPKLCEPVLDGIMANFRADELIEVAKDPLGSRCIIDGILDGNTKDGAFQKNVKKLMKLLEGNWSRLAVHRVGQHTVKKVFKKLVSINDKAALAAELAQNKAKLSGNNMGRSVMECCAVQEFLEGESAWKTRVAQMARMETLVADIVSGDVGGGGKKRKRKRKKTGDDDQTGADQTAADDKNIDEPAESSTDLTKETLDVADGKDESKSSSVDAVLDILDSAGSMKKKRKRRRKTKTE